MKAKVAIQKCADYDYAKVSKAVRSCVSLLGGMRKFVKKGDRVLLKINLLEDTPPERAITTHPAVVRAVCELVKGAGGFPLVGELGGGSTAEFTRRAFKVSGIAEAAEQAGAELVNFGEKGFRKVSTQSGEVFVAKPVLEADVNISLPKLKTHTMTLYTGAVKNYFGIIPRESRKALHRLVSGERFGASLVDLLEIAKPALGIMDAVVGMEGNGPSAGRPKKVGAIAASPDLVALDAVCSRMIGIRPDDVASTRIAAERGLGVSEMGHIQVVGEGIENVSTPFRLPDSYLKHVSALSTILYTHISFAEPYADNSKCVKCGECRDACPVGAIRLGPYPVIDRKKCIRCFCCHELCPAKAMKLRKSLLGALAKRVHDAITI